MVLNMACVRIPLPFSSRMGIEHDHTQLLFIMEDIVNIYRRAAAWMLMERERGTLASDLVEQITISCKQANIIVHCIKSTLASPYLND